MVIEDIALEAVGHVRRFMAADAGIDQRDLALRIEDGQRLAHRVDITGGLFAPFGDAVAEGDDNIAVLQQEILTVEQGGQ